MSDFQPDVNDTCISIPITFDYKGGRSQDKKGKIMMTVILVVIAILGEVIIMLGLRETLEFWQRVGVGSFSFMLCYLFLDF